MPDADDHANTLYLRSQLVIVSVAPAGADAVCVALWRLSYTAPVKVP
jgi:hypothetical protein